MLARYREDADLKQFEREVAAIRDNHTAGAVDLAIRAADALALLPDPSFEQLTSACRALVAAQPSMAPMVNLADSALRGAEAGDRLASICRRFAQRLRESGRRISRQASRLIESGCTLVTHSASRTVSEALHHAAECGRSFQVICTESRPVGEGIELAKDLANAGITVTLVADGALYGAMERAALALVGADAVTPAGVVNKTGTPLLALAAKAFRKPLYILCGSQKFLPGGYDLPPEQQKPAGEILAEPHRGISVDNRYFETTPIDLVTGVVTENGILTATDVAAQLRYRVHPALASGPTTRS